ncbi:Alpha/Beta hydrolase protein [Bombardia bombarda]|uniref:Alpha/Beta hydrolase protein n=1 Tax=Bombardia bombarda TaxID=252184 RepID=A0AA40BY59_9PEZI|nr:Alpha/Beta hydrolase protein [Bombardia bombarda]
MRLKTLAAAALLPLSASSNPLLNQHPLTHGTDTNPPNAIKDAVSVPFFASLERMARLVDIAYCVGGTGTMTDLTPPFSCASRCKDVDFSAMRLARTWNTGVLMSDSCGYIAVDHNPAKPQVVVAFRGTYSVANTIVDLSTVPQEYVPYPSPDDGGDGEGGGKKCDNCTVHMGFLASWRSAREVVLPELQRIRARYPDYPVHLVGHSLGGAVAALAGLELSLSLGWGMRAFGLDGDGDDGESNEKGKEGGRETLAYRRVTHANDPVPLLPLSEWGFRSHAGEVYIAKSDLQPAPEDLRLCRGDRDPECISGGGEAAGGNGWFGRALRRALQGARSSDEENVVRAVSAGGDVELDYETAVAAEAEAEASGAAARGIPTRLKLWQLFFAHRDYFWRLGLCVPGGDPADWGRGRFNLSSDGRSDDL